MISFTGKGRMSGLELSVCSGQHLLFVQYVHIKQLSVLGMVGVSCLASEIFRLWFFQIVSVLGRVEHSGYLYSSAWNLVH